MQPTGLPGSSCADTQSYLRVRHHFPQLAVRPELVAVADEVPGRAEEAAARYGFSTASLDWRDLLTDPRVGVVNLIRHLLGGIDALVADTATFVPQRARPTGATEGHTLAGGGDLGPLENEDYVSSQLRLVSARGSCWRPAGSRWGSRTTTASRCTARGVRWRGTSAGWAS